MMAPPAAQQNDMLTSLPSAGGWVVALRRLRRLILVLSALLVPAALGSAALPEREETQAASLAGQFLIASPKIADGRFYHTVILILRHSKDGALGIVINRPVEERSLASLLAAIGEQDPSAVGSVRIFAGGPVQPAVGFVVHSVDYHGKDTLDIDGRVAVTSNPEILRDIAHHKGPRKILVAFGYAGWGAGQLEAELARHDWFTAPEDPKLIFDDSPEKIWDDAVQRRSRDL
jgi:putative transcriptional regulator